MAMVMTRNGIAGKEKVDIKIARNDIVSGDLMFASGNYLVSQAIQKMTHSPWSHVGILFRVDTIGKILLLESVEDMGVRFAPFEKYVNDYENGKGYDGYVVVARCSGFQPEDVRKIAKFGVEELTQPYDRDEIAKIIARIAIGMPKAQRDREYICSELVYECFLRAQMKFPFNKKGFISPEDIWRDERVKMVCRVL